VPPMIAVAPLQKIMASNIYPNTWGVRPILFSVGSLDIPAYSFFVLLGLVVGTTVYYLEAKRQKTLTENGFMIAFGSFVGGVAGAKLLEWIINYRYFISNLTNPELLISGRSIVGGLIGGTIGALVTKHILGIKEKRGNLFAPAVAIGVAIGRLGCFFRGCCYGKPTALPWGVDFGDGVSRHPTQIYESLFMLVMFVYIEKIKNHKDIMPGQLFKILMLAYFIFRFLIEYIRVEPIVFAGMTIFQLISIGVIIYLARADIYKTYKKYGKQ